jgi:hypothetical protein
MRSPAAAIAWELRTRHRWGFIALGAYLLLLAAARLRLGAAVDYRSGESFAFFIAVPLTATFIYFLAIFSFGVGGDLAARESIYPPRMFTLPMSDAALAGWPMLFGIIAIALLWIATRFLAVWPRGAAVPVVWPALLAASLLAWTQALTWMPYPLPGMRVVLSIFWLASIDAVVMVALHYRTHEWAMLAILAPNLPLAFVVARHAVARARRNVGRASARRHVGRASARLGSDRRAEARPTLPFRSPSRAQFWFEWRMYGRALPALVAILLPFELSMLYVMHDTPVLLFETVVVVLLTPPLMAAFVAPAVSAAMTPFIARRPLTGNALITAKLRTALASTLAAWALVLVALPVGLRITGTSRIVLDPLQRVADVVGMPRAVALLVMTLLFLLAATWKQLVQSLCIGMSGRPWITKGAVFATLAFISVGGLVVQWIVIDRRFDVLWKATASILFALAVLRLAAAIWVFVRLRARRLMTDRALLLAAIVWNAAVFGVYALLASSLPGLLIRGYFLLLVAILAVPLVRLSAAPLALAWNRNR